MYVVFFLFFLQVTEQSEFNTAEPEYKTQNNTPVSPCVDS